MPRRDDTRRSRIAGLIDGFDRYLDVHARHVPFTRTGQWEHHAETIRLRRTHPSVVDAVADDRFLQSLYATLRAWGIGIRSSRLVDYDTFAAELRRRGPAIAQLDGIHLSRADASHGRMLWELIERVDVIDNVARVVALTKTLHHLLPDLVPPIDRAYTGTFFGWHVPEFQNSQRRIFDVAWDAFCQIGRSVDLDRHVGTAPWNTSPAKVVDNAIVGYCLAEGLVADQPRSPRRAATARQPRRESWTIEDLEADLEAYADELRAAGLQPNTFDTYTGHATRFVRWLAGRYRPRGPNG